MVRLAAGGGSVAATLKEAGCTASPPSQEKGARNGWACSCAGTLALTSLSWVCGACPPSEPHRLLSTGGRCPSSQLTGEPRRVLHILSKCFEEGSRYVSECGMWRKAWSSPVNRFICSWGGGNTATFEETAPSLSLAASCPGLESSGWLTADGRHHALTDVTGGHTGALCESALLWQFSFCQEETIHHPAAVSTEK